MVEIVAVAVHARAHADVAYLYYQMQCHVPGSPFAGDVYSIVGPPPEASLRRVVVLSLDQIASQMCGGKPRRKVTW